MLRFFEGSSMDLAMQINVGLFVGRVGWSLKWKMVEILRENKLVEEKVDDPRFIKMLNRYPEIAANAIGLYPWIEEFIFRGILQPGLKQILQRYNVPEFHAAFASIFITNILFSRGHGNKNFDAPRLTSFFGGLLYGILADYYGCMLPAGIAHMTNNAMGVFAATKSVKKEDTIEEERDEHAIHNNM